MKNTRIPRMALAGFVLALSLGSTLSAFAAPDAPAGRTWRALDQLEKVTQRAIGLAREGDTARLRAMAVELHTAVLAVITGRPPSGAGASC